MNQAEEDALVEKVLDEWRNDHLGGMSHHLALRAIRAAVAHERERAATVCEDAPRALYNEQEIALRESCAAAIRRGE